MKNNKKTNWTSIAVMLGIVLFGTFFVTNLGGCNMVDGLARDVQGLNRGLAKSFHSEEE